MSASVSETKWYRELTAYQWRMLVCACLGWALDIMDGYRYAIILFPAMSDLLGTIESGVIGFYGGIVLSIFMIGWALGGLIFGPIADRYGRAKTKRFTFLNCFPRPSAPLRKASVSISHAFSRPPARSSPAY